MVYSRYNSLEIVNTYISYIMINSGEAQVQVAKTDIDRELLSNYELILAARDHGTPTRQGTSTIRIDILDVNDNSPVFSPSEYFGTISEDATAGTPVVLNTPIVFSDLDDGLNSEVILSLDIDTIFSISPSYVISLIASMTLDREIESSFEIHIVAIDMGNPSLTSSATLSILVEDVNDNPPIFFPLSYSRILNEIVSVGTSVTTVFASDPDSGANMEISYHIFSGSQGNFDVNLASGLVQTTASLDRELTDSYDLVIIAFDSGSPFMTSTATVSIMIEDANDNMPLFTQSLYTGAVAENDSGSVVVILAALDTDINENAVLLFGFQDPIAGNILPFSIDSISGEMSVTGQLDRESTDIYSFDVVVRDNALIAMDRLTATANIVITINDVNDVAPSFPGVNSFRTSIQETTPITTIILSPIATDPDLGNGGNIKYSFSPLSTIFSVDVNTGEIRLIQSLDVDSDGPNGLSEYQITLVATDCGTPALSGSIPIIITVLNENDNVPIFDLPLYTVSVPENTSVDTVIITLIATDSDISGTIKYDIVGGNLDLLFSIDEDSGIVTNILSLFDLSNNIFELTVRAYESGDNSKSSLTSLHIQISDTNDNAPTFCQTADYQFTVNENSLIDTIIGQICGSDKDTGINGEFTFRIESGNDNNAFQIKQLPGSSTADITVANNTLNREIDDEYTLLLFITDNGIPALQSSPILVTIAILDVNDEIPTLDNLPFSIEVLEDAFGGTTIYQVLGSDSDSDSSLNADIFFNITDGNIGELFRIEPETGIITIIAPLNFNSQSEFTLTIQVSDKGLPPLFAQSTLQISIIDVNNHAPVFMPPYEISISEIFPMGSFVISVAATDQDATTNANLTYSISSGVNDVHFAIDNSGNITLNTDLDRETQSSYNLVVTACDMGTPMMCTSTQVTITITDNNDHVPVFSQPNYSFTVLEDRSADFKIGMVIATDLDEGVNGEVTYVFVSGDPLFSIDPNFGDILVDGVLDRETSDFYPLVIRAEDNGNPVLTALTNVSITVLDVNDNSPIIDVFSFSSQIREDAGFGELVFDVDVTDIDEGTNSRITLSILGGDFGDFFIIADTGSIHVNSSLSAEKIMQYELIIQAADGANPPRSDIQTLIIDIIDVNEFPPIFGQSIYYANLLEHSSSGTTIETVTASDFDVVGTVNSEISFFIPNLYSSDFAVDAVTGIITSIASFDREVSGSQLLVVMASNLNANPILQGSAEIQITIIDINDQIPYFINVPVTIEISELSPIGFSVLFLEALDDDDPTLGNGRVFFTSASENSAEFDRSFRINSDGLLEVNGLLDRENQQLYTAVAVVNDEGSPSLSSTTNIYIMLLDENDIPPLFSNSFYPIYYDEDLDPSSQNGRSRRLLTLEFTDADSVVDFQQSTFRLSSNSPFAAPEFSVTDSGELFLNIGLDRELLDTYTIFVEVINTVSFFFSKFISSFLFPENTMSTG
ncbi:Hedgling [Oopsacas minuta]|uniref:Hedgling n=1 Tax=Oopsacas minuta TaxID=111878 RepID=A0AAV7K787_9METZ|nr:Hedgling [Oopsacas minuta]